MSNYTKSTNFTAKDSLPTGDTNKVIRGSEFDTEFNAISVAVATKSDLASPTFTGTATFDGLTATGTVDFSGGNVTTNIDGGTIDGVTIGGTTAGAGTFSSLTATTADINAGTVDNTVIGGSTPAAGTFSSLTATTADINGGNIDGTVIGGSTPAAVSGTTGTFSGAVSGTTGTFSGAVTGSNLNVSNWNTAYGWGDHSTEGYLTSVTFSDMDAGAITTSGETFANSDTQIPTNAAVRNWVLTTYPTIVELNDLTANVTWANVPDANITQSSVTQHQAALSIAASQLSDVTATATELNYVDGVTSNIQTQIDSINPSPIHTATASGALANGDLVIVNSDGTVSVVGEIVVDTPSAGTPTVFESAESADISAIYDPNTQKVVIAYRDGWNSNYGTAVVGTVSGTSISFGTPVVFNSAASYYMSFAYDANAQKVVIAYRDGGNSNYGTAIVGTVSGTSISFGTSAVFETAIAYYISATYDANAQKVVIAYRDSGNSNYGTAVVGTVSGTSISFGTAVVFESANSDWISATYDANAQKVVIAYRDIGNSNYGTAIVGTVSGTSISFGTATVFESANSQYISAIYDTNAQKVVIAYQDSGNSNYGTAIVGTVSGTSISFGTATVFESASSLYMSATYDANAQRVVIAYQDAGNSYYGTVIVGTVSGTSISFGTATVYESANSYGSATYDANAQKVVIAYRDNGNSAYGNAVVVTSQNVSTNLTAENYIGISDAAYSDATTATIQIVGSVDDAQTGLTAGQKYYVQVDGSLGLTADSPEVFAGTAVSSTQLIIKG